MSIWITDLEWTYEIYGYIENQKDWYVGYMFQGETTYWLKTRRIGGKDSSKRKKINSSQA